MGVVALAEIIYGYHCKYTRHILVVTYFSLHIPALPLTCTCFLPHSPRQHLLQPPEQTVRELQDAVGRA